MGNPTPPVLVTERTRPPARGSELRRAPPLALRLPRGVAALGRDPRSYQIGVLFSLLVYGIFGLDFEIRAEVAAAIVAAALATQYGVSQLRAARNGLAGGSQRFIAVDVASALITALSLCLLLRTSSVAIGIASAALAIGSKALLRMNGKHLFNPSAFGLACALLLTDAAWISAGQWGSAPLLALWVAGLGSLVLRRAERSDITWAFLGFYFALLFGRALWLGDPLAIPLHAAQSGAFLIFAFFMISDPRTTPNSRTGRVLFAAAVAGGAFFIRFGLYEPNGLLWSLVSCSLLVPVLDRLWAGRRYEWSAATGRHRSTPGGCCHSDPDSATEPVPATAKPQPAAGRRADLPAALA